MSVEVEVYLLGLEIQMRVSELHELTKTIKDLDETYIEDPTDENKIFMLEAIERYKNLVDKTQIQLEALFEEERKANLPTDFLYRKLYRKLQNAY